MLCVSEGSIVITSDEMQDIMVEAENVSNQELLQVMEKFIIPKNSSDISDSDEERQKSHD